MSRCFYTCYQWTMQDPWVGKAALVNLRLKHLHSPKMLLPYLRLHKLTSTVFIYMYLYLDQPTMQDPRPAGLDNTSELERSKCVRTGKVLWQYIITSTLKACVCATNACTQHGGVPGEAPIKPHATLQLSHQGLERLHRIGQTTQHTLAMQKPELD